MKILVEYEPRHIRHAVVECPHCKNWFNIEDVLGDWPEDEYSFYNNNYTCPKCHIKLDSSYDSVNIEEKYHGDFPKVLQKKTIWE